MSNRLISSRRWRSPGALLVVAAGLSALWALSLPGSAAALPSNCSQSGSTVTCTFSSTGSDQAFTVPAGVSSVKVTAIGGVGAAGTANGGAGGLGAKVTGGLSVTPAEVLYVEVAGNAAGTAGGFNGGGGSGGSFGCSPLSGGGGGGASDIRTSPMSTSGSLGSRRLVAAGGGGGGGGTSACGSGAAGGDGGAAGQPGQDGQLLILPGTRGGAGGGAGTQTAGGAGGAADTASCGICATGGPGTFGAGGAGGSGQAIGGGGGGSGYYGGGGGGEGGGDGAGGGGGGGSNLVPVGGSASTGSTGTPTITISYAVPQPTMTSLASSVDPALATQAVTFSATVTPAPDGGTVAFDNGTTAIAGCGAKPVNTTSGAATCQTSSLPVGSDQITAVYSGDTSYQGSSSPPLTETIVPDTPHNLANLTLQYVKGSAKFQALAPPVQKVIEALANQAIAALGKITPQLTPAELARLVAAYKQGVAVLQAQGWLTAAQASTLDGLANHVHT